MNYETLREIVAARPKSFALLILFVVLNVALSVYLSGWQRPQLAAAQKSWLDQRETRAARQSPTVASRYAENERDLAEFRKRLIPKEQFASFLGRLFETAHSDKLAIKGVNYKPTPVKGEPGLFSYQIAFTVTGDYKLIKRFIADLTRFPELVTVDDLSLDNHSPTVEAVGLKVQLSAYLRMEGA